MARLNYVLVSGRLSKTSIRKGWRPTNPKPYAMLAADICASAVIKTKRQFYRAAARQERVAWMDIDFAPYAERPDLNADGPGVDASARTVSASPVSEAAAARQDFIVQTDVDQAVPRAHNSEISALNVDHQRLVSCRKRKAHEEFPESSIIPPTKKIRMDLPTSSSTGTTPVSSRMAEKTRARGEIVDVPLTSLRKAEKARARDDSAGIVNVVPSASSETVKEPPLLTPIRRPIVTANMASSSKVKLEDMPLPALEIDKLSAPIRLPGVQVNKTSTSLNRPIENINPSILPRREPAIVTGGTIRQPENSNETTDVIMLEDDYVDLPPIPDVIMFEDDYVNVPQMIGGYDPEYGHDMQVDLEGGVAGRYNDGVPFNGGPVDIFAMLGYVPEFMEVMEVDAPGNVEAHRNPMINGTPDAGRPVVDNVFGPNLGAARTILNGPQVDANVFPINADAINAPYDPREPLFPSRPQVEPFVAVPQLVEENFFMGIHINVPVPAYDVEPHVLGALNAPVEEQAIGDVDEHEELFNELFGNDGEEDDEEDEEDEEEDVLQVFV